MIRAITLIIAALVSTGCVYRIVDIPAVGKVNVEPKKVHVFTDGKPHGWQPAASLAEDLQKAGFDPSIVSNLSDVADDEYVIDEIQPGGECFSEPLLFVLTLGIIPHMGCEEFGHEFKVYPKGSPTKVQVNAKYTVRVMAGWLVWPAALSSSYAFTSTTVDVELDEETAILLLRKELSNAL